MGKGNRNRRNRLLVWILSLTMLLTGVAMPTGARKVRAEDGIFDLLGGKSITKTGTVEKAPYGEDLFCEEAFAGLSSESLNNRASGYSSLKFEATVNGTDRLEYSADDRGVNVYQCKGQQLR